MRCKKLSSRLVVRRGVGVAVAVLTAQRLVGKEDLEYQIQNCLVGVVEVSVEVLSLVG